MNLADLIKMVVSIVVSGAAVWGGVRADIATITERVAQHGRDLERHEKKIEAIALPIEAKRVR